MKYLIIILLLTACNFGVASSEEEKKSFSCSAEKVVCIITKETCIISNKKKFCTTSVDVSCNVRGDDTGNVSWQSKTTVIGNTTLILNCQTTTAAN